jgi:hypothetical protein
MIFPLFLWYSLIVSCVSGMAYEQKYSYVQQLIVYTWYLESAVDCTSTPEQNAIMKAEFLNLLKGFLRQGHNGNDATHGITLK